MGNSQVGVVRAWLMDAVGKEVRVVASGVMNVFPCNFFRPTVVVEVNHTMGVMRGESLGPITGMQNTDGDDNALKADTSYGFTTWVYRKHQQDVESIFRELDVGSAHWICCNCLALRLLQLRSTRLGWGVP